MAEIIVIARFLSRIMRESVAGIRFMGIKAFYMEAIQEQYKYDVMNYNIHRSIWKGCNSVYFRIFRVPTCFLGGAATDYINEDKSIQEKTTSSILLAGKFC